MSNLLGDYMPGRPENAKTYNQSMQPDTHYSIKGRMKLGGTEGVKVEIRKINAILQSLLITRYHFITPNPQVTNDSDHDARPRFY